MATAATSPPETSAHRQAAQTLLFPSRNACAAQPRPPAAVTLYVDGSCSGNPGPGGWSLILICGNAIRTGSGFERKATSQRMELRAPIEALKLLKRPCTLNVHSDSQYLVRGMNEWVPNWLRSNWKSGGVANQDLWRELIALAKPHDIVWHWVRGHAGDFWNEQCDRMARAAITLGASLDTPAQTPQSAIAP